MSRDLSRLFRPRSIAVIGGGAWCAAVVRQSQGMGFDGEIWPVHPRAAEVAGVPAFAGLADLPGAPDAAFVGINREATVATVAALAEMGAGGAVCFASGFAEAAAEDAGGAGLQGDLVRAAGQMPILGPNCYGMINALDGALLWPDQHGCTRVESGVAIITQSSNIAINMTMQRRGIPVAYVVTCGNMAQVSQAGIARALLDDRRVTAIGLHVEGFTDLRAWEALAHAAHEKGVPLVAIKVGRSDQARAATVSHTASLAGADVGAQALLDRLGIARVDDLPTLLETLKLLHMAGPLPSGRIASISCSGGEAALAADTAQGCGVEFPPLNAAQRSALALALGPRVALANPLDYHTYIWRDTQAMTRAFCAMADPSLALTMLIVDYPHTDARDWTCATEAAIATRAATRTATGGNVAVVATLPELMPGDVAAELAAGGVVPMMGLTEAVAAAEAAVRRGKPQQEPLLLPGGSREAALVPEDRAKSRLAAHGMDVPNGRSGAIDAIAAGELTGPLALKGLGWAHKTEAGAVRLGLAAQQLVGAAATMPAERFLVEEMVEGAVAELLIGVTRDEVHGFCLTLGAGGVLAEIMADSVTLLLPVTETQVLDALDRLRIAPLLRGYRGKPAADFAAIIRAVNSVQSYVLANAARVTEVEINPLICTPTRAVAVDALIREAPEP